MDGGAFLGPLSLKEVAPPASAAARKALELDDRLAEAYAAQAYVQGMFDWDWVSAESDNQTRSSNSTPTVWMPTTSMRCCSWRSDVFPKPSTQIEHAAQLDPLSAQVHSTFGRILYRARRFDEAV